jgi:hypothetical protein
MHSQVRPMRSTPLVLLLLAGVGLSGCNLFGGESAEAVAARREADGKAVGGACRHAGRAIEDCYALNRRADKSAVYVGWREMNDYMRENKIEPVAPVLTGETAVAHSGDAPAEAKRPAKPADKSTDKPKSKGKDGGAGTAAEADKKHDS